MSKHTPGPWMALEGKRGWQIHTDHAKGKAAPHINHWIANLKCESTPFAEEANARLIAAAPDLLEALTVVAQKLGSLLWEGNDAPIIKKALAAIAKAEGRP
ncbi:hypothetical protein [Rhizobium binxianense]|uniref:hypothetical protein n=1 Tax=Rhizobium binxianense TaxID=3024242 RepID=UPI0023A9558A|nr:hypothetical protein [Rhizobium sp. MJ22]WEA24063.1 hypothetical protein PO862_13190 [Rhizobium sp. MJ22]